MNTESVRRVAEAAAEVTDLAAEVATLPDITFITGSKLTSQLRRRSMDLTRLLAEMRRPS